MNSVYNVTREVWECGECKWQWIPRKKDGAPKQCPNRECRVRFNAVPGKELTEAGNGHRDSKKAKTGARVGSQSVPPSGERSVGEPHQGGGQTSGNRLPHKASHRRVQPQRGRDDAGDGERLVQAIESCPECGDEMVWNKVLRRWVCGCGYQGKVQK